MSAYETRLLSRANKVTNTAGLAPGHLQANLLILPAQHANDFHDLCLRNPVSCPLLGISTHPGSTDSITPAQCIQPASDFDLRTDFPKYRVYRSGKYLETRTDLLDIWDAHRRYVGFLIGCSFSFEDALAAAGLPPRHYSTGRIVAMYRSTIPLLPAGIFTNATCVVSMRPYKPDDIERVREVSRPYLAAHGEPVAWGWDAVARLGIADIEKPDFGQPQVFEDGEVPVFWACGVTPQLAVESAGEKIDGLVFSHEPGHMLVTDWKTEDLEGLRGGLR